MPASPLRTNMTCAANASRNGLSRASALYECAHHAYPHAGPQREVSRKAFRDRERRLHERAAGGGGHGAKEAFALKITLLGAAGGEVTGSCYLLETASAKVLVDCGMFQGSAASENWNRIPTAGQVAR